MNLYNPHKMENFLLFFTQNIFFFLLLISLVLALIFYEGKKGGNRVDNIEATRIINKENGLVLDFRSAEEFSQGHLANAINIPLVNISEQINTLSKEKTIPLLLVCKTGAISKKAGIELKKLGYLKTNILSGGMISWYNSGLPFIK